MLFYFIFFLDMSAASLVSLMSMFQYVIRQFSSTWSNYTDLRLKSRLWSQTVVNKRSRKASTRQYWNAAFKLGCNVFLCPLDGAQYHFRFMSVSTAPVRLSLRHHSFTEQAYSHTEAVKNMRAPVTRVEFNLQRVPQICGEKEPLKNFYWFTVWTQRNNPERNI